MVHGNTTNVEQQILHYLQTHPNAADTAEGIAMWWLGKNECDMEIKTVEDALNKLVRKGLLRRRQFQDGHVLYSRVAE